MKMMYPSDVICLLSGLLSRQRENECCPHSHLHFLSSHTVITKVSTCPSLLGMEEKDIDKGMVQIYWDSLQKQTHCQNIEYFSFSCCYSQVKCLLFLCQPKASILFHNYNVVTLKCKKDIKTA